MTLCRNRSNKFRIFLINKFLSYSKNPFSFTYMSANLKNIKTLTKNA